MEYNDICRLLNPRNNFLNTLKNCRCIDKNLRPSGSFRNNNEACRSIHTLQIFCLSSNIHSERRFGACKYTCIGFHPRILSHRNYQVNKHMHISLCRKPHLLSSLQWERSTGKSNPKRQNNSSLKHQRRIKVYYTRMCMFQGSKRFLLGSLWAHTCTHSLYRASRSCQGRL
jgi:hypothetical protein